MRWLLIMICSFCSYNLCIASTYQSELFSDSLSIYFFLLDDCPICIKYTPEINSIYDEYGDEIGFVGYFPNFSSKPEKINAYREAYGIEFQLKTDYYKLQAKKWNAKVTPEVVLYNHTTKTILYRGRIDNSFVRLGKRRNVVTERDLREAIAATLEGREIKQSYVKPVGCYINFGDSVEK